MRTSSWAKEYGDIYIVCGPIFYKGKHKTIGSNKVAVPDAFFKVVLCMQGTPKAIGFVYKNVEGNRPKDSYVNTVDEVERITGFDFFPALPDKADGIPEGYAVVNRCGILVFKGDSVELCSDSALFSGKTAGNLVFFSDIPFFSVYRSTFFNDADGKKTQDFTPFLIQFTPDQRIFYPVVTVQNLGFDSRYEITDFIWDGTVWTCSAKASENEKTVFSYCTFQPKEPLYAITPENAGSSLLVAESSAVKFRGAQETLDFSNAPARIKELLGSLPETADFSLACYTAGGHSPRVFVSAHNKKSSASQLLANALLSENWCGVLFEDGTFFLKGALFSRPVMNGGKPVALKLPKLLAGYVYSGFTVSGSSLYAAWEETSFFKTGRSGFICVDLDAVLYKVEK